MTQNVATPRERMTRERAIRLRNARVTLTANQIGSIVDQGLRVQGRADGTAGNFVSAADTEKLFPGRKAYYDQWLFNTNANSELALNSPEIKKLLVRATALETAAASMPAGADKERTLDKASDLFNEYLNSIQVTFNVIAPRSRKPGFYAGQPISGIVELAVSAAGNESLQLRSVKPKPGLKAERTVIEDDDVVIPDGFKVDLETGELVPITTTGSGVLHAVGGGAPNTEQPADHTAAPEGATPDPFAAPAGEFGNDSES